MKPKFRDILERCISDGIEIGITRAYKHLDEGAYPSDAALQECIDRALWNEIDEYFVFDGFERL